MVIQYLRKTGQISEKNYTRVKRIVLSIGLISLSFGLVLNRIFPGYSSVDFLSGFFLGISIVANILALLTIIPDRKL